MKNKLLLCILSSCILFAGCASSTAPQQNTDSSQTKVESPSTKSTEIFNTYSSEEVSSETTDSFSPLYSDFSNTTDEISLVNESGDTADGASIVIYNDGELLITQVGLNYENIDGSLISYIYIDGALSQKEQLSGMGQSSINLSEDQLAIGTHYIEIVQYASNNESTEPILYQKFSYEVKSM